jgi:hypothetical protein
MDILGLDLGTRTGYCYNRGTTLFCGTWELATAKEITAWGKDRRRRTGDPRVRRLCEKIAGIDYLDLVAYEDVEFSTYTAQTQLWAGLRSAIWLCARAGITECVPVGTLKKFATGHGGATKEAMAKAFNRERNPHISSRGLLPLDDNAIDAYFVWKWATKTLARTTK